MVLQCTTKVRTMNEVEITCPECGYSEITSLTPCIRIGFDASLNVDEVSCTECGYEGEP